MIQNECYKIKKLKMDWADFLEIIEQKYGFEINKTKIHLYKERKYTKNKPYKLSAPDYIVMEIKESYDEDTAT